MEWHCASASAVARARAQGPEALLVRLSALALCPKPLAELELGNL